ncbi:Trehalose transport system permease protein SugA [subsurface metagenome]
MNLNIENNKVLLFFNKFKILNPQENKRILAYWLLAPILIFFIVWNVIPLFWMVGLGFYKYTLTSSEGVKFVGLKNYIDILSSADIWHSLSRTLLFALLGVGIQTLLGLVLGFLFWGSKKMPGRRMAVTLLFCPMILTPVAAGLYFKLIFDPIFGIVNYFLKNWFGITIDFIGNAKWAFPAVILVDTWMWTPFMILITLAALGSVPKAELESAEVDRLPWVKRILFIILPRCKFILMLGILLRTIDSFKTMDLVHTMTFGGPGNVTELIAIYLYRRAFVSFTIGSSSALAVITLLTAIAFTSIYLYILSYKERKA